MSVVFKKDTQGNLNDSLVGYWKLDGYVDSMGLRTLKQWGSRLYDGANINPCTFSAGGKGAGFATFVRTSTTVWQGLLNDTASPLPSSNNPVSTVISNFSFAAWVKIAPGETVGDFFHNGNRSATSVSNVTGWSVGYGNGGSNPGKFYCRFFSSGSPSIFVSAHSINTGDWTLVRFSFDAGKIFKVQVNDNSIETFDQSGSTDMRAPNLIGNGGTEFGICSTFGTYSDQKPASCDLQEVGVWERVLSATNFSDLWNSSNGQTGDIIRSNGVGFRSLLQ